MQQTNFSVLVLKPTRMSPFEFFHLTRPALNSANSTKNNDAKIGINLKMISMTLGYIA